MLELVQLENGDYSLRVEYSAEGVEYFHEWYFAEAEATESEIAKVVIKIRFAQS